MPDFYIIIARKIFFPNFRGARAPPPAPRVLRLCTEPRNFSPAVLLLLAGELLTERCRTNDLLPSIPISCLPPCRTDPEVLSLNILINVLSQAVRGRPTGLLQSGGVCRPPNRHAVVDLAARVVQIKCDRVDR